VLARVLSRRDGEGGVCMFREAGIEFVVDVVGDCGINGCVGGGGKNCCWGGVGTEDAAEPAKPSALSVFMTCDRTCSVIFWITSSGTCVGAEVLSKAASTASYTG
jgi:hypothetical protein